MKVSDGSGTLERHKLLVYVLTRVLVNQTYCPRGKGGKGKSLLTDHQQIKVIALGRMCWLLLCLGRI